MGSYAAELPTGATPAPTVTTPKNSQGGALTATTQAACRNHKESGWRVVSSKGEGRSWNRLYHQLYRVVDDLYQCCELEGRSERVNAVLDLLNDASQDFHNLAIQLAALSKPKPRTPIAWEVKAHRLGNRSPRAALALMYTDDDVNDDEPDSALVGGPDSSAIQLDQKFGLSTCSSTANSNTNCASLGVGGPSGTMGPPGKLQSLQVHQQQAQQIEATSALDCFRAVQSGMIQNRAAGVQEPQVQIPPKGMAVNSSRISTGVAVAAAPGALCRQSSSSSSGSRSVHMQEQGSHVQVAATPRCGTAATIKTATSTPASTNASIGSRVLSVVPGPASSGARTGPALSVGGCSPGPSSQTQASSWRRALTEGGSGDAGKAATTPSSQHVATVAANKPDFIDVNLQKQQLHSQPIPAQSAPGQLSTRSSGASCEGVKCMQATSTSTAQAAWRAAAVPPPSVPAPARASAPGARPSSSTHHSNSSTVAGAKAAASTQAAGLQRSMSVPQPHQPCTKGNWVSIVSAISETASKHPVKEQPNSIGSGKQGKQSRCDARPLPLGVVLASLASSGQHGSKAPTTKHHTPRSTAGTPRPHAENKAVLLSKPAAQGTASLSEAQASNDATPSTSGHATSPGMASASHGIASVNHGMASVSPNMASVNHGMAPQGSSGVCAGGSSGRSLTSVPAGGSMVGEQRGADTSQPAAQSSKNACHDVLEGAARHQQQLGMALQPHLPEQQQGGSSEQQDGGCEQQQGGSEQQGTSTPACLTSPSSPSTPLYATPSRRRTPLETKVVSEEKQARAERSRLAAEDARRAKVARAQESRQSKQGARKLQEERVEAILNRCAEKDARSRQLREAHLAAVVQRAGTEARKVAEVAWINQLTEEDKKLSLQQKLEDGDARRRERLEERLARVQEAARELEAAAERRRAAEDARQTELAEKARRKEAAQAAWAARLEEERKVQAAAREAAKEAQQQLADELALAAQRAATARKLRIEARLKEAASRRAAHLETIRERAALGALPGVSAANLQTSSTVPVPAAGDAVVGESSTGAGRRCTPDPVAACQQQGKGIAASPAAEPSIVFGTFTVPALDTAALETADNRQAPSAVASSPLAQQRSRRTGVAGMSSPLASPRSATPLTAVQGEGRAGGGIGWQEKGRAVVDLGLGREGAGPAATGASSSKSRLKGLRRRAAKVLGRITADSFSLELPNAQQELLQCPQGQQLLHRWTHLVSASWQGSMGGACPTDPAPAVPCSTATQNVPNIILAPPSDQPSTTSANRCPVPDEQPARIDDNPQPAVASGSHITSGSGEAEQPQQDTAGGQAPLAGSVPQQGSNLGPGQVPLPASRSSGGGCRSLTPSLHVVVAACTADLAQPGLKPYCLAAAHPSGLLKYLMQRVGDKCGARLPVWDAAPAAARLLVSLLQEPYNVHAVLAAGCAPPLVRGVMKSLDRVNGTDSSFEPGSNCQDAELACLTSVLRVLTLLSLPVVNNIPPAQARHSVLDVCGHSCEPVQPSSSSGTHTPQIDDQHPAQFCTQQDSMEQQQQRQMARLVQMREHTVGYIVSAGIVHRLSELFTLSDQPMLWGNDGVASAASQRGPPHSTASTAAKEALDSAAKDSSGSTAGIAAKETLHTAAKDSLSSAAGSISQGEGGQEHTSGSMAPDATESGTEAAGSGDGLTALPRIPAYVVQGLHLLEALTERPQPVADAGKTAAACAEPLLQPTRQWHPMSDPAASLSLAFQETTMAGLPMLLTAVLLHAAPSCTPSEARPEALPDNFAEAALSVVRVLNNVARLDLLALQSGLCSLCVGASHLLGFLVSYATNLWPSHLTDAAVQQALHLGEGPRSYQLPMQGTARHAGPCTTQSSCVCPAQCNCSKAVCATGNDSSAETVALLNEVLLLLGYFCLLDANNQGLLMWGRPPDSVLQRLMTIPTAYKDHSMLLQVLVPSLAAICYNNTRTCELTSSWFAPAQLAQLLHAMRPPNTSSAVPGKGRHRKRHLAWEPAAIQSAATTAIQSAAMTAKDAEGLGVNPQAHYCNAVGVTDGAASTLVQGQQHAAQSRAGIDLTSSCASACTSRLPQRYCVCQRLPQATLDKAMAYFMTCTQPLQPRTSST